MSLYLGLGLSLEQWEEWPFNIVNISWEVLLAIGISLAGVGYLGVRRNYRSAIGTASFALGIVACVFFMLLSVAEAIKVFVYPMPPELYTWSEIHMMVAIGAYVMFGACQIVWGVAHIVTGKFVKSGLSLVTGILLIISGSLTASVFLNVVGFVLFIVAETMVTIMFFTLKAPAMPP